MPAETPQAILLPALPKPLITNSRRVYIDKSNAFEASRICVNGKGKTLKSMLVFNNSAAVVFVRIFDQATQDFDYPTEFPPIAIQSKQNASLDYGISGVFENGIYLQGSLAADSYSAPGDVLFFYNVISDEY